MTKVTGLEMTEGERTWTPGHIPLNEERQHLKQMHSADGSPILHGSAFGESSQPQKVL